MEHKVDAMIDKEKIQKEEEAVAALVDEFNSKLTSEMKGRPYLLVLSTLYEVEREGNKSKIAAQWNWRTNIDSRTEGRKESDIETGRKMMLLLIDQLKDVVERPKNGLKGRYKL
ncbi:TPA: hypothetical protein HA225_01370 [Candidatus Micrarchaeota archaeon]|nr:hypothetical protein [Candidatus Micrarchaeota archaeon]